MLPSSDRIEQRVSDERDNDLVGSGQNRTGVGRRLHRTEQSKIGDCDSWFLFVVDNPGEVLRVVNRDDVIDRLGPIDSETDAILVDGRTRVRRFGDGFRVPTLRLEADCDPSRHLRISCAEPPANNNFTRYHGEPLLGLPLASATIRTSRNLKGTPMEVYEDVDTYLAASDQWPDEITAIRPILLSCGLDETIKWGKPCYCVDADENVVLLQEFSDHLALMFFQGVLLDDPAHVLHAQGPNTHGPKRMKFSSTGDIESRADVIRSYVQEAIHHARAGTELPPRPDEELAAELHERLASDDQLAEAFNELTPGRQREYNLHISKAKQAATRNRRIDKVIPRILDGKGLRDR